MTLKTEPFFPTNLARSDRNAVKKRGRLRPRFLPFFTPRGRRPSRSPMGLCLNWILPPRATLCLWFQSDKGRRSRPRVETKASKEPRFVLKTVVLTIKNQSVLMATPCGRAPSFGFFSGGKVNLPPASGESPPGATRLDKVLT